MKIPCLFSLFLWLALPAIAAPTTRPARAKNSRVKPLTPLSPAFRLPAGRAIEPGIVWNEIRLPGKDAGVTRLWIYRPASSQSVAAGDTTKYPVVFVAPAGTALFYGSRVGPGSMPEHLPYARAKMMVVAYEIDGDISENADEEETLEGARLFRLAKGGVSNAKRALNWTLLHVPRVDAKRLYVAGHSSAGTLALQVAQNEPRIAACAAYAPCCDIENRITAQTQEMLEGHFSGYSDFLGRISPWNNAARLRCPTLLFHADDDSNVPTTEVYSFGQRVYRTNKKLVFLRVASGEHYDSMIHDGIPGAIRWLQTLPQK